MHQKKIMTGRFNITVVEMSCVWVSLLQCSWHVSIASQRQTSMKSLPTSGTASWCRLRSVGTTTWPIFLTSGPCATMATSVQKKVVSEWARSGDILAFVRCVHVTYLRNRDKGLNKFRVKALISLANSLHVTLTILLPSKVYEWEWFEKWPLVRGGH